MVKKNTNNKSGIHRRLVTFNLKAHAMLLTRRHLDSNQNLHVMIRGENPYAVEENTHTIRQEKRQKEGRSRE